MTASISKNAIGTKMEVDQTTTHKVDTASGSTITLKDTNISDLAKDNVIEIGTGTASEICVISSITSTNVITVTSPLLKTHFSDESVKKLNKMLPDTAIISSVNGDGILVASDAPIFLHDIINIGNEYFTIESVDSNGIILIAPELKYNHASNNELLQLIPAADVTALNEGEWGDRIKIIVRDSSVSSSKLTANAPADQDYIDLETVVGMEKSTLLELPGGQYASVLDVINSENTKRVILTEKLTAGLSETSKVKTKEFDLIVRFDEYEETYKYLSLVQSHSRYLTKIITPNASNLITVSVPNGSNPQTANEKILMPTKGDDPGWLLSGGKNGIPSTSEANTLYVALNNQSRQQSAPMRLKKYRLI